MAALRLAGKIAIVTGASSGLGRAIALAYAGHGTRLVVCADLQENPRSGVVQESVPTHELIRQRHGKARAVFTKTDVSKSHDVEACVNEAVDRGHGRLDMQVFMVLEIRCYSGLTCVKAWSTTLVWASGIRRRGNVNLRGVFLGCKYACAQFLKQDLDWNGRRGWIVNTASILGLVGISGGAAAYCASKGAVVNLTKQVAVDYAKDRIHCNALCPGFTKSAMTKVLYEDEAVSADLMAMTPWGEWGNVDDVAKGAVFLASDDAAWVTGVPLPVDGGCLAGQ
ncbi:hypothetical protein MMC07_008944 [Pseudocyphellaria aurata]|nr:hypothetical protein [Pseudocyphellaria aurata]